MKLIFDLDSLRVPLTGIGRYTLELAKGMQAQPEITDVKYQFLFNFVDGPETLANRYGPKGCNPNGKKKYGRHTPWASFVKSVARRCAPFAKGLRCLFFHDYIYHSPTYSLPLFVKRGVVTIHDMSMFRLPEFHPADRVGYLKRTLPGVVGRAALILTDSEFSKSEILHYFDFDPDRIVSVPLGVDPVFRPAFEQTGADAVLASMRLRPQSYTLFVSTIEPRKNIERLIDAYECLPVSLRSEMPLVLVGGHGWHSESIHDKIKIGQKQGWIIYMSYVEERVLPHLYANARLFAFLSLYEGFGLPILEAMASGAPVLSSNLASLPEVGGDCVAYVDPLDVKAIYEELHRLLLDDAARQSMSTKGIERARAFTWNQTVRKTLEAYGRITEHPR